MAESIADFLKREPAYQMVVLAGSGHLAHGSGIPSRVARQTKVDSAIILSGADLEIGEADYLLSPQAGQLYAGAKADGLPCRGEWEGCHSELPRRQYLREGRYEGG